MKIFICIVYISITSISASYADLAKDRHQYPVHFALKIASLVGIGAGTGFIGSHYLADKKKRTERPEVMESTPSNQPQVDQPTKPTKPIDKTAKKNQVRLNAIKKLDAISQTSNGTFLDGVKIDELLTHQQMDSSTPGFYLKAAKQQADLDLFIFGENENPAANIFINYEQEYQDQGTQDLAGESQGNFKTQMGDFLRAFQKSDKKYMIMPNLNNGHYNATIFIKQDNSIDAINLDPRKDMLNHLVEHAIEAVDPMKNIEFQHIATGVQAQSNWIDCGPLALTLATKLVEDHQKNPSNEDWQSRINRVKQHAIFSPKQGYLEARLTILETLASEP